MVTPRHRGWCVCVVTLVFGVNEFPSRWYVREVMMIPGEVSSVFVAKYFFFFGFGCEVVPLAFGFTYCGFC